VQRVFTALFLCLAILFGIAANASGAFTQPRLETRAEVFESPAQVDAWQIEPLSLELRPATTMWGYDPATDVWFYVRQNPWTMFDPLGLESKKELEEQIEEYNRSEKTVVDDINKSDMSDRDKKRALDTVSKQYDSDREALQDRIGKIDRTARDLSKINGGDPADYDWIDDADPRTAQLIHLLEHAGEQGVRDTVVNSLAGDYGAVAGDTAKGIILDRLVRRMPGLGAIFRKNKSQTTRQVIDSLPQGRRPHVRTVKSEAEIKALHAELTDGGLAMPPGTYPGTVTKMPDGTIVRMRPGSKSGGATIDITHPDGTTNKVHLE